MLDPNSGTDAVSNPTGNLQIVYAAFRGEGVFLSPNRGEVWNLMTGGVGNPLIRTTTGPRRRRSRWTTSARPPTATKGRIVLAKPALVPNRANAARRNLLYQGWLYAAVVHARQPLDGLYLTKDFGQNWTKVRDPDPAAVGPAGGRGPAVPTNDAEPGDYDIGGGRRPACRRRATTTSAWRVDPTNPNVVYLGGTGNGQPTGLIRIDATRPARRPRLRAYDNNRARRRPRPARRQAPSSCKPPATPPARHP